MKEKNESVRINAIPIEILMRKKSSLRKQESERGMVEARPEEFSEWTCKMAGQSITGPEPAVTG